MSKRHSRLIEYFITVGIEFESVAPINDDSISNPIRRLCVISDKERIPDGFEIIRFTVTGKDASLTGKGMLKRGSKHFLCYSRMGSGPLFSRIKYMKAKTLTKEWSRVPGKLMKGQTEYCLATKNDGLPPIADICVITADLKESCPDGYVKLPFTINNLAICFRHLPMDALGLRYQTCILDRYPRVDYANSPLSNTVAVFCQPNGADIRNEIQMPTFLSFVLTDSEGRKMYAITVTFYDALSADDEECCRRSLQSNFIDGFKPLWPKDKHLYHSKSVCILSYYPFFLTFRECLKEVYRLANSPGKIPIERYIINLCEETPLPIPDVRSVQLLYAHKPIIFRIPHHKELPVLDANIKKIFCCLSLKNTLQLFQVLLTQKYKILFTSSHISLITEICEGLTSFLQPFEWQFTYVPVLPYSVFGILEAPVPVLVGMHASRMRPDYWNDPEKQITIVDLDKNTVHIPPNVELIDVPSASLKTLKSELKHFAKASKVQLFTSSTIQFVDSAFAMNIEEAEGDDEDYLNVNKFNAMATRAAFYKFWINLIGPDYRTYLKFPDDDDVLDFTDIFRIDDYIASRPKNMRKFWKQFSETQAFQKFIEDLTYQTSEDREVALQAFYNCVQYVNEEKRLSNTSSNKPTMVHRSSNASNVSLDDSRFIRGNSKYAQIDPFTEWLEDSIPDLIPYQVVLPNQSGLDENYKFAASTAFPALDESFMVKPRRVNLEKLLEEEERAANGDEQKESVSKPKTLKKPPKKKGVRFGDDIDAKPAPIGRTRRQRSLNKNQTPLDRAKFQLLQVYGTWFAAHVAALDFKDIPGDEVDGVVSSTLGVLYGMTAKSVPEELRVTPDELIYKACLILCGKFGRKKEASELFKDLKKKGVTVTQKTYGAYTNAMASSGANMLLSAHGSTSSGASVYSTHRRSFAPSAESGTKMRSMSAVGMGNNTRLVTRSKINTIKEDDETSLGKKSSVPVTVRAQSGNVGDLQSASNDVRRRPIMTKSPKSVDVTLTTGDGSRLLHDHDDGDNLIGGFDISDSGPLGQMQSAKSSPVSPINPNAHKFGVPDTMSSPHYEEEEDEAKESQPSQPSSLETPESAKRSNAKVTASSSEYSTPSVLSSSPAMNGSVQPGSSSMEPLDGDEKVSGASRRMKVRGGAEKQTEIIDYRSIEMEAKHVCKCGYVLSDAQIMVGWCSEFKAVSKTFPCIMCRTNMFSPKLHVKYQLTRLSDESGICAFEVVDKLIEYISPLQLRTKVNRILALNRLDFEDPELFRVQHQEEFWNMLWYFYHRQLDLSFMLGDQDAASLTVHSFGGVALRRPQISSDEQKTSGHQPSPEPTPEPPNEALPPPIVLEPQSDIELISKLKPIYTMATTGKMGKAIAMWLTNRSQTAPQRRELSVWNLSVFDSFHDLGIPENRDAFVSEDEFVDRYKTATKSMTIKERDRAWNDPALSIQKCFEHPRLGNARLQSLKPVLSGKAESLPPSQRSSRAPSAAGPLGPKPSNPVPLPPSKEAMQ